jgi:hypothetical protein
MIVTVKRVIEDYADCNFCRRRKGDAMPIERPYKKVLEITGNYHGGITVSICRECLAELIDKAEGLL